MAFISCNVAHAISVTAGLFSGYLFSIGQATQLVAMGLFILIGFAFLMTFVKQLCIPSIAVSVAAIAGAFTIIAGAPIAVIVAIIAVLFITMFR